MTACRVCDVELLEHADSDLHRCERLLEDVESRFRPVGPFDTKAVADLLGPLKPEPTLTPRKDWSVTAAVREPIPETVNCTAILTEVDDVFDTCVVCGTPCDEHSLEEMRADLEDVRSTSEPFRCVVCHHEVSDHVYRAVIECFKLLHSEIVGEVERDDADTKGD